LGGLERMFQSESAPLRIGRLARGPPPDLEIHHRVDDCVVSIDGPRGYQFGRRIVKLLQTLGRTESAFPILRVSSLPVTKDRRVIIEETSVVILGHFFAEQARVPKLSPAAKAFLFGLAVKLPKFAHPEVSGPEIAFLRFPLAGLIVAFSEEAFAFVARHVLGSSL